MSIFTPGLSSVESLFSRSLQYKIPAYQRDYSWTKLQAQDLLDDLFSGLESNEPIFLGTIILAGNIDAGRGIIEVIDGQQRLTTLMLFLVAFRERFRNLGLVARATMIDTLIHHLDRATGKTLGTRLLTSKSIHRVFEHVTASDWDCTYPEKIKKQGVIREVKRIRPVLDLFRNALSDKSESDVNAMLRCLFDATMLRLEVAHDIDALGIFERTNARGMDLEISDLLKNFLYARKVDGIEESWDTIVKNADGTLLRMLKYYYASHEGHTTKSRLYRQLKRLADTLGADGLTEDIRRFSEFYALYRNPLLHTTRDFFKNRELLAFSSHSERSDDFCRSLQALKLFGVTQATPPLYAALEAMSKAAPDDQDKCAKAIVRLINAMEKLHFINNAICDRVGNEVEKLYADVCIELKSSTALWSTINEFVQRLSKMRATSEEFEKRFSDLTYSKGEQSFLYYVFDRVSNVGLTGTSRINIYDPNIDIEKGSQSVEHFLPQTPRAGTHYDAKTKDALHNIGNLFVIDRRMNSKLANLPPIEKIQELTGPLARSIQTSESIKEFVIEYGAHASHWDSIVIRDRAQKMAEMAYSRVWNL